MEKTPTTQEIEPFSSRATRAWQNIEKYEVIKGPEQKRRGDEK